MCLIHVTQLAAKVAKYFCAFPEGTDVWLKGTLADCVFLFGQKILNLPKTQQNKRWVLKTAKIKQQVDERMNFRRTSKGGGGESFLVQKNTLQILKLYTGLFEDEIDTK